MNQEIIDKRYSEFKKFYIETYPPNGAPTSSKAMDLKQAIDLSYTMWLTSPGEFEEVIMGLFDEFDAALGLIGL
jgi:hypothetical protein